MSSDFLQKLILSGRFSCCYTLLVQSEFAEKVLASCVSIPSLTSRCCHEATFLSVFVQSFFEVKRCFRVSRSCFVPPPHVESTVLRLVPNPSTPEACKLNPDKYRLFLRTCFSSKNQVLSKVLGRKGVEWGGGYGVDGDCCGGYVGDGDRRSAAVNRMIPATTNHPHPINLNRRPWELSWRDYCTLYSA